MSSSLNNTKEEKGYSQWGQDIYFEKNVFKGFKNGTFMDIGAHDGISLNNTLYFEKKHNWIGINIEPIKEVYDKLIVNRPYSINLNIACSENEGTFEFINTIGYAEMLSGLKDDYDKRHLERLNREIKENGGHIEIRKVPTQRVESICEEYGIKHIHLMSIDVEGAEFSVIKSINFDKVFIDLICFENNYSDVSKLIIKYLEENNYKLIYQGEDIYMINKKSQFN
jgi:FkbM family methyltransferase